MAEGRTRPASPADTTDESRRQTFAGLPWSTARWVLAAMIVAVVGYGAWWGLTPSTVSDTATYQETASDLGDLVLDHLHDRPPGYPALLAVTGSVETVGPFLFVAQMACHLTALWLVLLLGRRFALGSVAEAAIVVVGLSPPLVEKVSFATSEALAELLVVGVAYFLTRWCEHWRRRDALLAGLLAALAALTRPTYLGLGVVIAAVALATFWRRRPHRKALLDAAALVAGTVVLVGGFATYNAVRFDYPGVTPLLGWNLSTRTASFVEDLPDDDAGLRQILVTARDRDLVRGESHSGVMYVWTVRPEVVEALGGSEVHADRELVRVNGELIARHPLAYAAAVTNAGGWYLLPSATTTATGGWEAVELALALAHFTLLALFVAQLFGVVGLFVARRLGACPAGPFASAAARATWLVSLALALYTAVVSVTIDVGNPRYRTPTDLLIVLMVAGGTTMVARAGFSREVGS